MIEVCLTVWDYRYLHRIREAGRQAGRLDVYTRRCIICGLDNECNVIERLYAGYNDCVYIGIYIYLRSLLYNSDS